MLNVAEALSTGVSHHQSGQLALAEQCYRQVLEVEPQNPNAIHLLGVLALQANRFGQAIELIEKAVRLDDAQALFHSNLAEAYRLAGELDRAIASNESALRLQPDSTNARASLGAAYRQKGDLPAAAECFREVVRAAPTDAEALLSLGEIERELGHPADAEAALKAALQAAPDNPRACAGVGLILFDQKRLPEARASFEAAVHADPTFTGARNNLGCVLNEMELLEEAEAQFCETVRTDPQLAMAHYNLATVFSKKNRHTEAIDALNRCIALSPDFAPAHGNLACALIALHRYDEGIAAARRAITVDPKYAPGYSHLAACLRALGQLDEAIAGYRSAVQLDPRNADYRSNLIYTLNSHPAYHAHAIFQEHLEFGRAAADRSSAASPPHASDRTPGRRLRVGYVSGHFWDHAVNYFSEPILASHDHAAVEVFCYSNNSRNDETNQRLRTYADHWREIGKLSDDQAAEMIRNDKIDILVDLAGHIAGNRLLVFARKPAPVQVTYLGYQNTTGMQAMDYRLTDDWADPPGETDAFYTEKLVRLPQSFFCYRPSPDAPPIGPLPAVANGYVTFGSFNNFAKVTPEVLATWAQILRTVAGSRIMILAPDVPSLRECLARTFAGHGIETGRWRLANRCRLPEYLRLIEQVDIALDPFPFNGHTTTCDVLWQGVPVVTLAGRMYASRFGSSAHQTLGLASLVAHSPEQYVEVAARLASDVERLATLRAELRARMTASPLLDFAGFTRHLEAAYRQMWTEWCSRDLRVQPMDVI